MAFGETLREFGVKISLIFDKKKAKEAQDAVEDLGAKMKSFALGLAGMTAGLFESQNLFTSNSRALEDQAQTLGITTEALQAYEYAAKVGANVNREELVGSFEKLADTMDQARAGIPEAAQAIYQIGEAAGIGGQNLLNKMRDPTFKVTDAMNVMADGIKRIQQTSPMAAQRLAEFALGNAKLIPLLRMGSDGVSKLTDEGYKNFVMSDKMIRQGKAMDQQMSRIWLTLRKMSYEIGFGVMKHLTPMINAFQKWFEANKSIISSDINDFLDVMADTLQLVYRGLTLGFRAFHAISGAMGGTKNALSALVVGFGLFKAAQFAGTLFSAARAVGVLLPGFTQLAGAVVGVGRAFKAFSLIGSLADILPALQIFGSGAIAALAPLLPVMLGIGAAVTAVHDLATLLQGGSFKDTWTGKGWEKAKEGVGWIANKIAGIGGGAQTIGQAYASPSAPLAAGAAPSTSQTNTFNTTNNISIPPGTTPSQAHDIITRSTVDSHQKLIKAAADAQTSRVY